MFNRNCTLAGSAAWSCYLAIVLCCNTAVAQVEVEPASSSASRLSRDQQYDELARDVEAMERELGIIKRVVKLISPTVVHVEARPSSRLSRMDVQEAGSGVIIQLPKGLFVLTNRHVIKHSSPSYIRVQLADGRILHPAGIWADPDTDVAVMSLNTGSLVPARIGDSDRTEIGEHVLAMGSPFGLSQSVTRGIISAKGRYNLELGEGEVKLQNFLQTDAAINPGNSGGPLINLRGEVVGINTAIASSSGGNEGIGFSIPINLAVRVARELTENGEVSRGRIGVKLDASFNDRRAQSLGLPRRMGARVSGVDPASPAERAELQANDVILQFNGMRVEDDEHLVSMVQLTEVGRRVEMVVFRDGDAIRTFVEVGDHREVPAPNP